MATWLSVYPLPPGLTVGSPGSHIEDKKKPLMNLSPLYKKKAEPNFPPVLTLSLWQYTLGGHLCLETDPGVLSPCTELVFLFSLLVCAGTFPS